MTQVVPQVSEISAFLLGRAHAFPLGKLLISHTETCLQLFVMFRHGSVPEPSALVRSQIESAWVRV